MPVYTVFMSTNVVLSCNRVAYSSLSEAVEAAKQTLRAVNGIIYDKVTQFPGNQHWVVGRLNALPGEAHFVGDCVILELQTT